MIKPTQAQIEAAEMRPQIEAQMEGLAIGLEQRGEKSAAHIIRRYLALTAAAEAQQKMDIEDCDGDLAEIEQIAESRANIAADPALRDFIKDTPYSEPNEGGRERKR